MLAIEKPKKAIANVKPYFKRVSKKLFPNRIAPKTGPKLEQKLQQDPKPILFNKGIWLCDRCGWISQNEHWCPNLNKAELEMLASKETEVGADQSEEDTQEDVADDEASFTIDM